MELDEDLAIEPNPLADWRTPYLDNLLYATETLTFEVVGPHSGADMSISIQ